MEKEKGQDSEKPIPPSREEVLDKALEEIKITIKDIAKTYSLSIYEIFGILKAFEIDLIESSKQ